MLMGVLTLTACVLIYKFDRMVALVNGNDVAFTLPESDFADKEPQFLLNDIGVSTKDACDKSCVVWEMVRPVGSNSDLIEENFVKFPIQYGVTLPNMQTRVYKELRKGRYTAAASIAMIKDGKVIDSKNVVVGFTIE